MTSWWTLDSYMGVNSSQGFVIISYARSGSNLLASLLRSHPDIRCDGELLNPTTTALSRSVLRAVRRLPGPYFGLQRTICPLRVYGFKLFLWQVASPLTVTQSLHRHGWKLLYLQRKNVVRQALSLCVAKATDRWARRAGEPPATYVLQIDPRDVLFELEQRFRWMDVELEALNGLPRLPISYEDDLADKNLQSLTIARICEYLGIRFVEPMTNHVPTDERPLRDIVTNLGEVLTSVRASPYSSVLKPWDHAF